MVPPKPDPDPKLPEPDPDPAEEEPKSMPNPSAPGPDVLNPPVALRTPGMSRRPTKTVASGAGRYGSLRRPMCAAKSPQMEFIAGRKTGAGFGLRHDPLAADTLQNMPGAGYPIGTLAMHREKRTPVFD